MKKPHLLVLMYHYVRDVRKTEFSNLVQAKRISKDWKLHPSGISQFENQLSSMAKDYDFVDIKTALNFLKADVKTERNLCIVTFDDGLQDHYSNVFPILKSKEISGVFLVNTSSIEGGLVLDVHKNHLLRAKLGFDNYKKLFTERMDYYGLEVKACTDVKELKRVYRWDNDISISSFNYMINYQIPRHRLGVILSDLFEQEIGSELHFSEEFYMNWNQIREMQEEGMCIGGHSHNHVKLSKSDYSLEIKKCKENIENNCLNQEVWPFSYPYGKFDTFNEKIINSLEDNGFDCGFSNESGLNYPSNSFFKILRYDPKDIES